MKTRSGEDFVKVLDFGIAKWRDEVTSTSTTSAGAIIGTPSYLSPEQARGELIDARADLYSVGALLYELLSGRPPFHGLSPVATVAAHLHRPPPPLGEAAPDVPPQLAALVHRALEKRPDDRFASADEMRGALLQLASPAARGRSGPPTLSTSAVITGDLELAQREDFAEFEREVTRLRRSRVAAPVLAALLVAAVGAVVWRWSDVYALARQRAPGLAAALPASLRPADLYDGAEHEPNNGPVQANSLPLPPGADGAPGGGVAVMRGFIGAKASDTAGDVDVFRIEVPESKAPRVLVAEWSGEKPEEGIRGLDVQLTLNSQPPSSARISAPLVAVVDHGGPGKPERLSALVSPGEYFLSVRERHADETGPVEKPSDPYRLLVRLAAPEPGAELEPNDEPDDPAARLERYPEWRALAERNRLGEGRPLRGDLGPGDADVLAVAPAAPGEALGWLAVVPDPGLAVALEAWRPDDGDRGPPGNQDRAAFARVAAGGPGEVLLAPLGGAAEADFPTLARLTAPSGGGRWVALGLGTGSASGAAVLSLAAELSQAGREAQALELLAAFGREAKGAPAQAEAMLAAGRIAEALAARWAPADLPKLERASQRLGAPVLAVERGALRYRAAFEAIATGSGRPAEEAALQVAIRGTPCQPAAVAERVATFPRRFPESALLPQARLAEARAREAAFHALPAAAKRERAASHAKAVAAWKASARDGGAAADEAARRLEALSAKVPAAAGGEPVCQ